MYIHVHLSRDYVRFLIEVQMNIKILQALNIFIL